jgi:hypothetical protein
VYCINLHGNVINANDAMCDMCSPLTLYTDADT